MEIDHDQAWDVLADDPDYLVEQVCEAYPKLVKEYLQNFLLIGYNYDGEMIAYTSAKSQLQSDSLNTGLYKYITQSAARGMPPVPPAGPPTGSPY